MYLKTPTWLYHPTLAPAGKLFEGSEARPIPEPGPGWCDSPAGFPDAPAPEVTAESVTEANAKAAEAEVVNTTLTEQLSDALTRAESAESDAERLKDELAAEQTAHGETRGKLETASNDIVVLDAKLEPLRVEADKVPGLVEQLAQANQTIADQGTQLSTKDARIAELEAAVAAAATDPGKKPGKGAADAGETA